MRYISVLRHIVIVVQRQFYDYSDKRTWPASAINFDDEIFDFFVVRGGPPVLMRGLNAVRASMTRTYHIRLRSFKPREASLFHATQEISECGDLSPLSLWQRRPARRPSVTRFVRGDNSGTQRHLHMQHARRRLDAMDGISRMGSTG